MFTFRLLIRVFLADRSGWIRAGGWRWGATHPPFQPTLASGLAWVWRPCVELFPKRGRVTVEVWDARGWYSTLQHAIISWNGCYFLFLFKHSSRESAPTCMQSHPLSFFSPPPLQLSCFHTNTHTHMHFPLQPELFSNLSLNMLV